MNHLESEFETFELDDCKGQPHSYRVHYHDPHKAMALCLRISKAGGGALARVLESNLPLLIRSALTGGVENFDAARVLKTLVAAALSDKGDVDIPAQQMMVDVADTLISAHAEGLLDDLFANTFRDEVPLSSLDNFNAAYRANYAEMRGAMTRIFQINGFFDFLIGGLRTEETAEEKTDLPTGTQPTSEESPSPAVSSTG